VTWAAALVVAVVGGKLQKQSMIHQDAQVFPFRICHPCPAYPPYGILCHPCPAYPYRICH